MALDEQGNYVPTPQATTTIPAPTAADVYSSDNIAQAVVQPPAKLDLSDPSGIYDYYMKGEDVTAKQSQYEKDLAALAKTKATAASRKLAIEQNPLEGMQYIVGAQSRAGQLDAAQISALADAVRVSQSALLAAKETAREKANIAMEQRSQLTSLITQYPGAKITYYDTIDSAAKKIEKYNKDKEKEDYKDTLKKTAISLGIKTKGKNTKALEKAISKYYKEEGASKKKELNKTSSTGSGTVKNYTETEERLLTNELIKEAESNGFYGNYLYEYVQEEASKLGLDVSTGSTVDNSIRRKFGQEPQTKEK